jgi:hypothetical protein
MCFVSTRGCFCRYKGGWVRRLWFYTGWPRRRLYCFYTGWPMVLFKDLRVVRGGLKRSGRMFCYATPRPRPMYCFYTGTGQCGISLWITLWTSGSTPCARWLIWPSLALPLERRREGPCDFDSHIVCSDGLLPEGVNLKQCRHNLHADLVAQARDDFAAQVVVRHAIPLVLQ